MRAEQTLTAEEQLALDTIVPAGDPNDDLLSAADLENSQPPKTNESDKPKMYDPAWSDYVMTKFEQNEVDPNGLPMVHGLRRVVRLLLGPIVRSEPKEVFPLTYVQGVPQPTTVSYSVTILMLHLEDGLTTPYEAVFGDCADVTLINTDPAFQRHAAAVASTKAEARCLRKALQLRGVAAEEMTSVPPPANDGKIRPEQINFLQILCSRCNINVMKFVNAGKVRYKRVEDVPFDQAKVIIEHLSGLQNNPAGIKKTWQPYDPNWRGA
jgi:hypothetical protein